MAKQASKPCLQLLLAPDLCKRVLERHIEVNGMATERVLTEWMPQWGMKLPEEMLVPDAYKRGCAWGMVGRQ